jgi:hypothetical protein
MVWTTEQCIHTKITRTNHLPQPVLATNPHKLLLLQQQVIHNNQTRELKIESLNSEYSDGNYDTL